MLEKSTEILPKLNLNVSKKFLYLSNNKLKYKEGL